MKVFTLLIIALTWMYSEALEKIFFMGKNFSTTQCYKPSDNEPVTYFTVAVEELIKITEAYMDVEFNQSITMMDSAKLLRMQIAKNYLKRITIFGERLKRIEMEHMEQPCELHNRESLRPLFCCIFFQFIVASFVVYYRKSNCSQQNSEDYEQNDCHCESSFKTGSKGQTNIATMLMKHKII